jgi:predicted MFS family arabinose efflux permease
LLELPWSLSWLIGVPLAGLLIAWWGWRAPFAFFAVFAAICQGLTLWLRFDDGRLKPGGTPVTFRAGFGAWRRIFSGPILVALGASALLATANANMFLVYGEWMESQYGLSVGVLGMVSIVISLAELAAEGASAALLDRLGKMRALLGCLALNVLAYITLPQLARNLTSALIGVAVLWFTIEFCIVSVLPVLSEMNPTARGTIMAANSAFFAVGVLVISLVAPRLWQSGGLSLNAGISAILAFVAGCLLFSIRNSSEATKL